MAITPIILHKPPVLPPSQVDLFPLSEEIVEAERHAPPFVGKAVQVCGQYMETKDLLRK